MLSQSKQIRARRSKKMRAKHTKGQVAKTMSSNSESNSQPDFQPVHEADAVDFHEYIGIHAENIADRLQERLEEIDRRENELISKIEEFEKVRDEFLKRNQSQLNRVIGTDPNAQTSDQSESISDSTIHSPTIPLPDVDSNSSHRDQYSVDEALLARATAIRLRAQKFSRVHNELISLFSEVIQTHSKVRTIATSIESMEDSPTKKYIVAIAPEIESLTTRLSEFARSNVLQNTVSDLRSA